MNINEIFALAKAEEEKLKIEEGGNKETNSGIDEEVKTQCT